MTLWNPEQFSPMKRDNNPALPTKEKEHLPPARHARALLAGTIVVILLPMLLFYFLLQSGLTNIPYWDDYDSILGFMIRFVEQPGVIGKLFLILFTQHNEYKIIFGNALFALEYMFLGHINLVYLQVIGNLFVILLLFSLYKLYFYTVPRASNALVYFIPVPFLIFQLQYWNTVDWASPALQNITVLPFAILSLYYLDKKTGFGLVASCLYLTLAVFSSGNGLFIIPLGFLMIAQSKESGRMIPWLLTSGMLIALYFYKYSFGTGRGLSLGYYLDHFDIRYTLSFLGTAASRNNYHITMILGTIFVLIFLIMIFSRFDRKNPPVFYVVSFVFITALVVSTIRSQYGVAESLSSRYRIYSDILLALTYIFIVNQKWRSRTLIFVAGCAISIPFCLYNDYLFYPQIVSRHNQLVYGISSWRLTGVGLTYPSEVRANMLLNKSIKFGIYNPPTPKESVLEWPVIPQNNIPLPLDSGQTAIIGLSIHDRLSSSKILVQSIGIYQGNYGNSANGNIRVSICSSIACTGGARALSQSENNSFFFIPLKKPIDVLPGERLQVTIIHQGGDKPVALWLWPANPRYPQDIKGPHGALPGKAIRIALKCQLQDQK